MLNKNNRLLMCLPVAAVRNLLCKLSGVLLMVSAINAIAASNTPLGDATGAASQKMLSDGTLSDGYIYHHGARSDQDSAGFAMDFSVGSHVLVIETGGGAIKNTGIDGVGGRILLDGFSSDDLIYNDNLGNMALLTTDGVHAASWTGSGNTLTRFQSSDASELQQIVFTDYADTGFTAMANLFYSQADGRFEDSVHYNANVIIFG